jgi:hypothetical protein
MKTVLLSTIAGLLMTGAAAAQNTAKPASAQPPTSATQPTASSSAPAPANAPARIAPGSVIPVSLTKTIDAKKAKTGDEVVAKVTQDMKSNSGEVLVPKDTKVIGHVTEAQAHSKEQKESQLGIAFDRAVMKNGSEMQMPMSIQAIIGEQNDQNNAGAGGNEASAPSRGSGPATASGSRSGMAGSAPAPAPTASANDTPGDAQTGKSSRAPITAQTEGVVGISNLTLSPLATNSSQGSVVSSDKNNVKLESGTLMLLRVNQ